ncbi:hypothetical protein MHYP_G00243450 [Metynnis hypsauchen]
MEYKIRRALACLCCCLLCSAGEEVVRLQELEGNTITFQTGLTGVQSNAQILWFYGPEIVNNNIVDSLVTDGKTSTDFYRDRFRDRLQLDRNSGSLTITNISREDSGVYMLQVITGNISEWCFSVDVSAPVSKLSTSNQSEQSNSPPSIMKTRMDGTVSGQNAKEPQKSLAAVLTPVGLEIVAMSLILFMWFWKKRSKEEDKSNPTEAHEEAALKLQKIKTRVTQ